MYNPSSGGSGGQMTKINGSLRKAKNYFNPMYYSNILKNTIFTSGYEKGAVSCLPGDPAYKCKKDIENPSWGFTTNCFNKIIDASSKKDFYCGGSHIMRLSAYSDSYYHRTFLVKSNNLITGVVYKEWGGDNVYLY